MNKTVTINIAGIVFHIDEQAYEILKQYLSSIKNHFAATEGKEEIISDIEYRIAEIFQEKVKTRQVILMEDVEEVRKTMGNPQDFGYSEEEEIHGAKTTYSNSEIPPLKRRLFRDPDDKVLGGVCSGISSYLDVDPVWLRLIFAFAFFIWGTGLFLYIVLWIILPIAKTTAEKLQMRGEKVNISNIEKTIKEEMEGIKSKVNEFAKSPKEFGKTGLSGLRGFTAKILGLIVQIFTVLLEVFIKIGSVIFIIIGLAFLVAIFGIITGTTSITPDHIPSIIPTFFESEGQLIWTKIALGLIIGVPAFLILYKGLRVLLNIKVKNRSVNLSFLALWVIGLLLGGFLAIQLASNFKQKGTVKEKYSLLPRFNTLYISAPDTLRDEEDNFGFSIHSSNIKINGEPLDMVLDNIQLSTAPSKSGDFELIKIQTARGKTKQDAFNNAKNIKFNFSQNDSILNIDSHLFLHNERFRNQHVRLILKIPVGKSVVFNHNLKNIIYDIENVTNTYDGNMLGKKWTMTAVGLKCEDCDKWETSKEDEVKSSKEDEWE